MKDQIEKLEKEIERQSKELAELKELAKKEEFKDGDWIVAMGANRELRKVVRCEVSGRNLEWSEEESKGLCHSWPLAKVRKATPSEIETFLIAEAEKKGFVKGAKVKNKSGYIGEINDIVIVTKLDNSNNSTPVIDYFNKNGGNFLIIHSEHNFTSPLVECELLPSCPSITINGYKAEFKEWGLDFNNGCAKIDKDLFINIHNLFSSRVTSCNQNKYVTSVKIGNGEFTIKQIQEIAKYYETR